MKRLILLTAALASFLYLGIPSLVYAQDSKAAVCEGIGAANSGAGCGTSSGPNVNSAITTVINLMSVIVGVLAIIMIIVAGIRFITSGGSPDKVSGARSAILYAVIGLVVVAFAQIIVRFVLNKLV